MPAGDAVRGLVAMTRPGNAALACWAVLIGAAVAVPLWGYEAVAWGHVAAAMAAAFLVLAFGNVVNDIADRDIDRHAHPDRPLATGRVTVGLAAAWAAVLGNAGLAFAALAGGLVLFLFALANALLLLAYNIVLKGTPLAGNLVVAWLVASAFPFGALAAQAWSHRIGWGSLFGFAAMAFLATLARENAKGLQDAPHDEGRLTLARLWPWGAQSVVAGATLAACALAAWMALDVAHPWWLDRPMAWDGVGSGPVHLGLHDEDLGWWRWGVAASLPPFLVGVAVCGRDPARSQRWLKAGMLVAMLGYSWGALLAFQGN